MNNLKQFFSVLIMILLPITSLLSSPDNWKNYVAGGRNINAIAQEDSLLWIGTDIGLVCINRTTRETRYFDEIDGLPHPNITTIAIDSQNCKWIGTGGGLVKYDDENWVIFITDNSELPSNFIQMLYIDKEENIWIGSGDSHRNFGGKLSIFDRTNWKTFDHNSEVPYNYINAMQEDNFGNYWVCTEGGLAKYDGTSWELFTPTNSDISSIRVRSIVIDNNNVKWIGLIDSLNSFDDTTWTTYAPPGSHSIWIYSSAYDSYGKLWLGTHDGLLQFDGVDWLIYNHENSELLADEITAFIIDEQDNKWLGTFDWHHDHGLIKYDGVNWEKYNTSPTGLPSNYINTIHIDKNNTKWICTDWGLVKHLGTCWVTYDSSNSGLPYNRVGTVDFDSENHLWMSTLGDWPIGFPLVGSLAMFNGSDWAVFNKSNSGLPSNGISAISISDNDIKWFGTGNGLVRYDGNTWDVFNTDNSPLPHNYVRSICTVDSKIWVALYYGLAQFDGNEWTFYNQDNSGLPSNKINYIASDNSGQIWLATDSGLVKFDGIYWEVFNSSNSDLPMDNILTVHIQDNIKWLGGISTGLVRFDDLNWQVYNEDNSNILDNTIYSISSDFDNNIWMVCSSYGISIFNKNGIVESIPDDHPEVRPEDFHLGNNYPNPFNGKTLIPINLPHSGMVTISLYNVLGQRIQDLFVGKITGGKQTISIKIEDHSSGVYFYSVKFDTKIKFGKMLYIK